MPLNNIVDLILRDLDLFNEESLKNQQEWSFDEYKLFCLDPKKYFVNETMIENFYNCLSDNDYTIKDTDLFKYGILQNYVTLSQFVNRYELIENVDYIKQNNSYMFRPSVVKMIALKSGNISCIDYYLFLEMLITHYEKYITAYKKQKKLKKKLKMLDETKVSKEYDIKNMQKEFEETIKKRDFEIEELKEKIRQNTISEQMADIILKNQLLCDEKETTIKSQLNYIETLEKQINELEEQIIELKKQKNEPREDDTMTIHSISEYQLSTTQINDIIELLTKSITNSSLVLQKLIGK